MRRTGGWDPTVFVSWSLVAFSLCITLWQGWNCTLRYLSKPVIVEDSFESLSSIPPIQLSICKKFTIGEPLEPLAPLKTSTDYYDTVDIPAGTNIGLPPGTIFTYANSTEAFWLDMDSRGEKFREYLG